MKVKLLLTMGILPLILAGCGNNDGQFSSHPNNVAKVVAKSKRDAQKHSAANSTSLQNAKYQVVSDQLIQSSFKRNQITAAKAQIANRKLRFQGQIKAIGKVNDGEQAVLVSTNQQNYVVFTKSNLVKSLRTKQMVTVYGSGLATIAKDHQQLGINQTFINSQTLMFNADQFTTN